MFSSKSLLLLLVAVLGSSWICGGGSNGLAYACPSSSEVPQTEVPSKIQCPEIIIPTIYDLSPEVGNNSVTVGIRIGATYHRLPNAPFYRVEMREGSSSSSIPVKNTYYEKEKIVNKSLTNH
ncbi:GSCOCT00009604001.2-RA-CDS [Cotesia congregata]|uniref:Venom protein 8 n=1 Tax=Cotesia congregata TaxID=51543 RepID=A0A8J2GZY5_COTCN|nr:GSCOCT00009604001.2-RA-CDS [Cotesia congregata]CAG5075117.1 Putative venom protein 8 [Cotesia congregata]